MSEISTATKCTLCGRSFYGPAIVFQTEIKAGQVVPPRMMHFLEELISHIRDAHAMHFQVTQQRASAMQGWMLLSIYDTLDKDVMKQRDYFRWTLHQQTLRARAQNLEARARMVATEFIKSQDASMEKLAASFVPDDIEHLTMLITEALEELQEILEEPGKYPDEPPAKPVERDPRNNLGTPS